MKSKVLVFLVTLVSLAVYADDISVKAPKDTIGTRDADESVRVIGNLPYSNQWTFERPSNYLYLSFEQVTMASPSIKVSHFENIYSANLGVLSVDYFSRLFGLADPTSNSFFKRFGFWGRYRVGVGVAQGSLADEDTNTVLPTEKSSLFVLEGALQANFSYDWSEWVQPYIGFGFKPYYYRNGSSMGGAESEGESFSYGPAIGVHLPVLFSHRGSIFGEVHNDIAPSGSNQIFGSYAGVDFGLGVVF